MPKHCLVKGCKSNLDNGFPFPIDRPDLVRKWVIALQKHQELPPDYHDKLICPAHFCENDFLKSRKNAISRKAVPSVFIKVSDNYISDEEQNENCTQIIKKEPEDCDSSESGGKQLKRKRLTIPVTEPDSEPDEDDGSDYEPTDSNEDEMNFTEEESDKNEVEMERVEDDSHDNKVKVYLNETNEFDMPKIVDPTLTFIEINTEDGVDSDYEPVSETFLEILQEKVNKKLEIFDKDTETLKAMEEIIKNQSSTIRKLEIELKELEKSEDGDHKPGKSRSKNSNKITDYSNPDLQVFSISLYYFNPKVYSYLGSIMPYLPPKNVVIDWIKSGHAFTLFPAGVLIKEHFVLD